ncbi:MAG: TetR family transcriptional regulator [Rhizomicrobium sp.]
MAAAKRRYSGRSFEDRRNDRREQLVRATLVVAGRAGLEGTSVAAICAEAGLTPRYFYESYSSRDQVFMETYRAAQRLLFAQMNTRQITFQQPRRRLQASTQRSLPTLNWRAYSWSTSTTKDQQCDPQAQQEAPIWRVLSVFARRIDSRSRALLVPSLKLLKCGSNVTFVSRSMKSWRLPSHSRASDSLFKVCQLV